ncbi:hypothetical protein CFC21_047191 [Triticum aestivum]|uniref:F-box domain-containing protein n=2 Tax=Triticum aestivum TaxID=4565 RepID=A0A9R1FWJ0_WHEAT|nr:uncharacterized protein LOC123073756 [Triticum aestivum]KAF7034481.1 hypothetical protein CFC21_045490 [Triticum aestivum]KAF7036558.1 hypothetical protein CFC21_047191 [Triticum aestivum]
MTMDAPEMCYVDLLHQDIQANIFSCLPDPTSIAHSMLACKTWCHLITDRGILRRHRPPMLCGIFQEVFSPEELAIRSIFFSPIDQIASPELAEKTNNIQANNPLSLPSGPWSIVDSLENLLLLCHERLIIHESVMLAIYNPVTHDLQALPPVVNNQYCFFFGAAIFSDDALAANNRRLLRPGASDVSFKVVCVVAVPGDHHGEWIYQTFVHSGGSAGDSSWSTLPYRASSMRTRGWCIGGTHGGQAARAGAALFKSIGCMHMTDVMMMLMLDMRTGGASLLVTPKCGAFVDYGRGDDEKLWFVCINKFLVLRLYSLPKPREGSITRVFKQCNLEREVELYPIITGLVADVDAADVVGSASNVHSRNGYVFFKIIFKMDKYDYFAVHLRSMRVQRPNGEYRGSLYPFMCREDS